MPWLVRSADSFPLWEMVKWWLRLLSTILPLVAKLRTGCSSSSLYTRLLCSPSLVTKTSSHKFIVPPQIPLKLTGEEGRDSLVAEARLLLGPVTVGRVVLVLFLQSWLPSAFL